MELQPNLLAVNSLPPVFAAGRPDAESDAVREEVAAAEPVNPIVNGFFISPLLQFDNQALALIFQVRDSESGEVQRQFPRESVVERLRSNPDALAVRIATEGTGEAAANEPEAPPIIGAGGSDADEAESVEPVIVGTGGNGGAGNDTATEIRGIEIANGAPAIGGTSTGVAAGLGPGNGQGVNVLV